MYLSHTFRGEALSVSLNNDNKLMEMKPRLIRKKLMHILYRELDASNPGLNCGDFNKHTCKSEF